MVTLNIAKLLDDNGFGTLDQTIFWEEIPVGSLEGVTDGIWIVSRGSSLDRFNVTTQAFDIYCRNNNKVACSQKLESILHFLQDSYADVCDLPLVPPYNLTVYNNVRIRPTSGIENVGTDANERIIKLISAEVQYDIAN